jgi:hypothetical protein
MAGWALTSSWREAEDVAELVAQDLLEVDAAREGGRVGDEPAWPAASVSTLTALPESCRP